MQRIDRYSKAREVSKAVLYFLGVQLFFAMMMISFNYGGPVAFGVIAGVPPICLWAAGGRKSYRLILYFLCMAFVIGQRTLHIGQHFRIVPSTAILWILAIICLHLKPQFQVSKNPIPSSAILLCAASMWGVLWGAVNGQNISEGFYTAHMLLISLPAFFVVHRLVHRIDHVKDIINILALGCIFLSFLAIAEYFGMGFIKYFSGFVKGKTFVGQQGMARMSASFWGGPTLANYLALCLPLTLGQFFSSKTIVQKCISLTSLILSFIAIYLSFFRGIWMPVLASIVVYFYFKGAKGIVILFILVAVGSHFIPESAKARMGGLYGKHRDTSSVKREHRARDAWNMVIKSPIVGNGWGASGLVHSEFIQAWADAGLAAFIGYIGTFIVVLRRLFYVEKIRNNLFKEYFRALFSSVLGAMLILIPETWYNLPEMYAPLWIVMALAYQYPNVVRIESQIVMDENRSKAAPAC